MARLIILSPVTIFILSVVLVTITEASDCKKQCTPTESFTEYGAAESKQYIEENWPQSCGENVVVKSVGESFYLRGIDTQHFIFLDVIYRDNCNKQCKHANCITVFEMFPRNAIVTPCGVHNLKESECQTNC